MQRALRELAECSPPLTRAERIRLVAHYGAVRVITNVEVERAKVGREAPLKTPRVIAAIRDDRASERRAAERERADERRRRDREQQRRRDEQRAQAAAQAAQQERDGEDFRRVVDAARRVMDGLDDGAIRAALDRAWAAMTQAERAARPHWGRMSPRATVRTYPREFLNALNTPGDTQQ